jgi:hypothetical protein
MNGGIFNNGYFLTASRELAGATRTQITSSSSPIDC